MVMANRLSHLQKRILVWLEQETIRMKGTVSPSHQELVNHLAGIDQSNISHSLRNLENKRLIAIGRSPGGKAEFVNLTIVSTDANRSSHLLDTAVPVLQKRVELHSLIGPVTT